MTTASMTQTKRRPQPTPQERGRDLGRNGYSISESIYCRNLFEVRKPTGTVYRVDATSRTCSCPTTRPCKHLAFVDVCRRYARYLAVVDRTAHADAILDSAYAMDARATAELVWDRGSRFTAAGLRFRAEAVRLYDLAAAVRFGWVTV